MQEKTYIRLQITALVCISAVIVWYVNYNWMLSSFYKWNNIYWLVSLETKEIKDNKKGIVHSKEDNLKVLETEESGEEEIYTEEYSLTENNNEDKKYFIVVPHHSITKDNIDKFYSDISLRYEDIKNIVIISPNHYGNWTAFFESFKQEGNYCFAINKRNIDIENCVRWWKISFYDYQKSNLYDLVDYEGNKNNFLLYEHWVWEHFKYINKYFPDYDKVYPIVLEMEYDKNPKNTQEFFERIKDYNFWEWNTLFIASVDFSHHVFEKVAVFHDMKTVEELNKEKMGFMEVDCPNCLFLLKSLANYNDKDIFKLENRTSSSEIMWKSLLYENTSHVMWEFVSWPEVKKKIVRKKNLEFFDDKFEYKKVADYWGEELASDWVYGMFFWDSHLTRSFDYERAYWGIPASYEDKKKYFECFFQNADITKDTRFWKNRMFFSFDYVWVNLETAVCEKKDTVYSDKSIRFLTKPEYIDYFKDIWINLFNIANNHSYDYGNTCFAKTKEVLESKWLKYFGEWRWKESTVFKMDKNGTKVAFIWINDTTYSWDLNSELAKIRELKSLWYNVILSIHWWIEYRTTNTDWQQKLAYKFVDAWVDMIIWHHPHVTANYEEYKGVPIFYSLWNFIFDQGFDSTLDWLWVVYRIDNSWLRYDVVKFKRRGTDFAVDCGSWE